MKFLVFLIAVLPLQLLADGLSTSALCESKATDQLSFSKLESDPDPIQRNSEDPITLITWNTHKYADVQNIFDISRLGESADLIFLQEAMHSSVYQDAFSSLMPEMNYTFYKSFCFADHQATGVMTASRFLLQDKATLTSPGTEPIIFTHKVSGYSTVKIDGTLVHLINTHALNFNVGAPFEQQIDALVKFASTLSGPMIWAGDFNTWNPGRKIYLAAAIKKLSLVELEPELEIRNLILDHIFMRGFTKIKVEILNETSSDHFPIRAIVKLNK